MPVYRIYYTVQRDGLTYNLADIPSSFELEPEEAFDQIYMNALFDIGYELALDGYPWKHKPPGVSTPGAGP